MVEQNSRLLLVSDFNTDILRGYLSNSGAEPPLTVTSAPFGQTFQALLEAPQERDVTLVWTLPESVSPTFKSALEYATVDTAQVLAEVDEFCVLLRQFQKSCKCVLAPSWVTQHPGYGMLDMKNDLGITNLLMRMNLRLAEQLDDASNIYLLNTQKWLISAKDTFNEKLWYLSKTPFSSAVFKTAVEDIQSALHSINGNARKLVVVDLDNTLWGGVVGDDGWQALRLGGHDAMGEGFADFQQVLKSLTKRGILLGIVSKNTEAIALEAFEKHPEMILQPQDFAAWRINWQDKAQNIQELVNELSLGLQSVVFIDDNPVERARVRDMLPEVLVPEWPHSSMLFKNALLQLRCFDTPAISQEDRTRAKLYNIERQRNSLKEKLGSLDDWLETLQMKVTIEELAESNLVRAVQLLNKTNQMNLSTRRMTESELLDWLEHPQRKMWVCRVTDKFGDSGLTGIVSLQWEGTTGRVIDFVLSCRVMGRKVEESLLYVAINHAQQTGIKELTLQYQPTAKNQPCLSFLQQSALDYDSDNNCFNWHFKQPYAAPKAIALTLCKH